MGSFEKVDMSGEKARLRKWNKELEVQKALGVAKKEYRVGVRYNKPPGGNDWSFMDTRTVIALNVVHAMCIVKDSYENTSFVWCKDFMWGLHGGWTRANRGISFEEAWGQIAPRARR